MGVRGGRVWGSMLVIATRMMYHYPRKSCAQRKSIKTINILKIDCIYAGFYTKYTNKFELSSC